MDEISSNVCEAPAVRQQGNLVSDETSLPTTVPVPLCPETVISRSTMADFVLPQSYSEGAVRRVQSTVPISRPGNKEFVSPHPDPAARRKVACITDGDTGEFFILHPSLIEEFTREANRVELVPYMTRLGNVRLWPIGLADSRGRLNSWPASARRIADDYGNRWVRVVSDKEIGGYVALIPQGDLGAPDWSGVDLGTIYETTLAASSIQSGDHPLLNRLRGAI